MAVPTDDNRNSLYLDIYSVCVEQSTEALQELKEQDIPIDYNIPTLPLRGRVYKGRVQHCISIGSNLNAQ
jgi:hypothetical protein